MVYFKSMNLWYGIISQYFKIQQQKDSAWFWFYSLIFYLIGCLNGILNIVEPWDTILLQKSFKLCSPFMYRNAFFDVHMVCGRREYTANDNAHGAHCQQQVKRRKGPCFFILFWSLEISWMFENIPNKKSTKKEIIYTRLIKTSMFKHTHF